MSKSILMRAQTKKENSKLLELMVSLNCIYKYTHYYTLLYIRILAFNSNHKRLPAIVGVFDSDHPTV